jgi:hypothetical protein
MECLIDGAGCGDCMLQFIEHLKFSDTIGLNLTFLMDKACLLKWTSLQPPTDPFTISIWAPLLLSTVHQTFKWCVGEFHGVAGKTLRLAAGKDQLPRPVCQWSYWFMWISCQEVINASYTISWPPIYSDSILLLSCWWFWDVLGWLGPLGGWVMVQLGFKCVIFNHPNKTLPTKTELGLLLVKALGIIVIFESGKWITRFESVMLHIYIYIHTHYIIVCLNNFLAAVNTTTKLAKKSWLWVLYVWLFSPPRTIDANSLHFLLS